MNLPQLNNLIHYVNLMYYSNFLCLSIKFHIILVIVLMTIQVFYISIIFDKLLPMFMIHVSFINIAFSLFTCFMSAYSKKMDTRKNCMYPRVLSLYETVISICALLCDPNGVHVINLNIANYICMLQQLYP